tara:strand:- start:10623 stop:11573 length:951 start_codon:yes stop_codon:yes gene_type:complete
VINFLKKITENFIQKISNKFFLNQIFQRNLDDLKLQNGQLFSFFLKTNLKNIKNLDDVSFKVYSQNNEDAILEYLILSLKLKNIKFIEIGTEDYSESNTRFIYEKYNCDGLIIDNTKNLTSKISKLLYIWKGNLRIEEEFVNKNNVNTLIDKHFPNKSVDIFSLDIDGVDYWILKELPDNLSKIIIAEYNPYFGPDLEVTVPYSDNFNRTEYHSSNLCFGMSLRALINLMENKGYSFIGSASLRSNAFFIKNEFKNLLSLEDIDTSNLKDYTNAHFRENKVNNLNYTEPAENINIIGECKVFNLKTKKICKINQLF